jgi:hypothetical protein
MPHLSATRQTRHLSCSKSTTKKVQQIEFGLHHVFSERYKPTEKQEKETGKNRR